MGKRSRRWDKFEVQDVIARYLSGEDVQAIAEEYGRSVRSRGHTGHNGLERERDRTHPTECGEMGCQRCGCPL